MRFAGETAAAKLARIRDAALKQKLDALVLSDAHAVAWAFNIRGADVAHTPLPLSYALVPQEGRATIFIDGRKLSNAVRDYLSELADVAEPAQLVPQLSKLAAGGAAIGLDAATAADALSRADRGGGRQAGARHGSGRPAQGGQERGRDRRHARRASARRRGAGALPRLARQRGAARQPHRDRRRRGAREFRRDTGALRDVSFPTISGTGANGAIVHYRVTRASNRRVIPGDLLLVDSGAQYEDGTTDVTRTIATGAPSAEMRDRFTRVLKGHIAIATAVFVDGTSGAQLDAFARQFLWQAGLDYDHGTGHGVGSYLSVHEGPARISKIGTVPLKRGMILSNEPGYYKAGAYGIRIENLVLVREADIAGAERPVNGFETLTLAPIDRRLIEHSMLTASEIAWLDAYHARVAASLARCSMPRHNAGSPRRPCLSYPDACRRRPEVRQSFDIMPLDRRRIFSRRNMVSSRDFCTSSASRRLASQLDSATSSHLR